ncbi:acyl-CoA thioesterase [Lutimaribacter marinistellae]|uniref:Acyl-CoA thioesterase n=1 Tax=Lutimaribacter marinistellae TaxID=1820329 RepID=A0ABV7TCA0_9RHOB
MNQMFTLRRQVEFNHCDPAGIVFYPRYFEMISATVERFLADEIDLAWADMDFRSGAGTPLGEIEARFHAPSRLGDKLELSLQVERIGRSSFTARITCACVGEARFTCRATMIHTNIDAGGSQPWPAEARARMTRFLIDGSDATLKSA